MARVVSLLGDPSAGETGLEKCTGHIYIIYFSKELENCEFLLKTDNGGGGKQGSPLGRERIPVGAHHHNRSGKFQYCVGRKNHIGKTRHKREKPCGEFFSFCTDDQGIGQQRLKKFKSQTAISSIFQLKDTVMPLLWTLQLPLTILTSKFHLILKRNYIALDGVTQ